MSGRALGGARRVAGRLAAWARPLVTRQFAPVAVLAYHSVSEPDVDPWNLAVSPERFDQHVAALTARGRVVDAATAAAMRPRDRLWNRRPTYAITFDDGYADNLHHALPILERHDAPATVFVATGYLGGRAFWWDQMAALVLGPAGATVDWGAVAAAAGLPEAPPVAGDDDARQVIFEWLYRIVVSMDRSQIDTVLHRLAGCAGLSVPDTGRSLTEDELRELSAHPLITIGAHTVNHRRLPELDERAVLGEVRIGNDELDRVLGDGRRLFAYPFGAANRGVADVVQRAGFDVAFTTEPRRFGLRLDRMLLPRLHPHDLDAAGFERWLASA